MKAVFVDMDDMLQEYTIPTKSDMRALVKVGVSVGTLLDAGNQAEPPPPPTPCGRRLANPPAWRSHPQVLWRTPHHAEFIRGLCGGCEGNFRPR